MTIQEIESRFADEWILLEDPLANEALEVTRGSVICHSKDRDEVYRRAIALPRPKRYAVLFTGQMPANTAIVLRTFRSMRSRGSSLCGRNCSAHLAMPSCAWPSTRARPAR